MSYESANTEPAGILFAIRSVFSGWRRSKEPQYAHPWTAYCPTKFKPCETARTDVIAEKLEQASRVKATANSAIKAEAATSQSADSNAAEKTKQPVQLRLVASNDLAATPDKPVLPALAAATGKDFQLAARLGSVSALNRRKQPVAASRVTRKTGLNRPIKKTVTAKHSRNIEPPAVGRKTRKSAEIVHLKLTLARAEHKHGKALKVA